MIASFIEKSPPKKHKLISNATPKLALLNFEQVFNSGGQERVDLIKRGVSAEAINQLAKVMLLTREQIMISLGLPRSTIQRKIKLKENLSIDQAEKVVGLARLVGQAVSMVSQSGDLDGFDAPRWVAQWLDEPNKAIGNQRPAQLMDTVTGQELVSTLLAQMQSGAYA